MDNPTSTSASRESDDVPVPVSSASYGPLRPIVYMLATLGHFHFRHGPHSTSIWSKFTTAFDILIGIIFVAISFGSLICILEGKAKDPNVLGYLTFCLSAVTLVSSLFMFSICWRKKRIALLLCKLMIPIEYSVQLTTWKTNVALIVVVFLHLGMVAAILSFYFQSTVHDNHVLLGSLACVSDRTLSKLLISVQTIFWVTINILPACFFVSFSIWIAVIINAARKTIKVKPDGLGKGSIETSFSYVSDVVESIFEMVDQFDQTFKLYMAFQLLVMVILSALISILFWNALFVIPFAFEFIIILFAAGWVNYEVQYWILITSIV